MKNKKKIAFTVLLVVIAVCAGGVLWIDLIAKAGVETASTYALGVDTTLDGMHVGILSGKVGMSGLDVANPTGFESTNLLRLGRGNVEVSLGSLMEETVEIPELSFSDVQLNLERRGGKSNYQTVLDNLQKFGGDGTAPAEPGEPGKAFIIKHVFVENVSVQVDLLPIGGKLSRVPIQIEKLELRDVGTKDGKGMPLAEVSAVLLKAILEGAIQAGGQAIPREISQELLTRLNNLKGLDDGSVKVLGDVTTLVDGELKQIGALGQKLTKTMESGTKSAESAIDEVGKGLNKLLGGSKKED